MNVRINLLPHREERRKRGRQHFAALGGLTAVIGLVIVGAGYLYVAGLISMQDQRNTFLKSEIAKLDKEIAEIQKLRGEIAALLARKQIIETLQADRAQTVHLLDQLVRQMPEGVYLRELKQQGLAVNVQGYAQSNARVSTLMRNIESSPWLSSPKLIEIKAARVGNKRLSQFTMNLQLKRVQLKEAPKDAAKAPAKKG
ncbi:MAG: PilN domain-containing protein [Betaproteobacteria bacterium]|nr:PilN domain-containing protein [Betaproteobacteria bacterium]